MKKIFEKGAFPIKKKNPKWKVGIRSKIILDFFLPRLLTFVR